MTKPTFIPEVKCSPDDGSSTIIMVKPLVENILDLLQMIRGDGIIDYQRGFATTIDIQGVPNYTNSDVFTIAVAAMLISVKGYQIVKNQITATSVKGYINSLVRSGEIKLTYITKYDDEDKGVEIIPETFEYVLDMTPENLKY